MKYLTILFLLLTLSNLSASAREFTVSGTLNGASVVPSNGSTGTGTFNGTIDDVSGLLTFTVTYTGLNSAVSTSRLYSGAAGSNGTAIANYGVIPSPFSATTTLSPTQISDLLNGNTYFQIHTSNNTGGEIRGQLSKVFEVFTSATINDFYAIGGYSYLEGDFPVSLTLLTSPYVRSGPLPNNDFTFVATSPLNLAGRDGRLTTNTANQAITLTFKGNNVRKMRAFVRSEDVSAITTSGTIIATATTNLGNSANVVGSGNSPSVGFRVLNENEYIVQVVFSAPSDGQFTTLDNIIVGDDSPQNVSLNFDGINDFVALPNNVGNFNYNQSFTVSCWVKPNAAQPGGSPDVAILEKWDQTGPYPFVIRYLTSGIDAGKVRVARFDGIHNPALNSVILINDGKWHHIAITFFYSTGLLKLYIDGVLQGEVVDNTNTTTSNSSLLYVGQRGNGINRFKGEIDEIRLWTFVKYAEDIVNDMFCKNPNTTDLQAAYNFNNGVPNGNNTLITQVQDAVGSNHGTLSGFAKTGDASNFVTGQVKYVKANATGSNDGSSWANAFTDLQTALAPTPCNDLFDVYVATGIYKPDILLRDPSFVIRAGMKIYGGFAGTEKTINERNMALIHTTNNTTLSGDLAGNDIPFNFALDRPDNSNYVVNIEGSDVVFDGFTVRGSNSSGSGISINQANGTIKNSRVIDNVNVGLTIDGNNASISACSILGNNDTGLAILSSSANIKETIIANNGNNGIYIYKESGTNQTNINNCTVASNGLNGLNVEIVQPSSTVNNNLKNTLIYGNGSGGIITSGPGTINNTITYSLVQGVTTGTGNLNGNTVNPQFVNPLTAGFGNLTTNPTNMGDYRLKWCSKAIGVSTNTGISPLDLDRKPRNFDGTADMGAYEFLGNTPSPTNATNSTITGTIDSPTYAGGAIQTIESNAKILAPAGAIDFKAPNAIILNPGFEARGVGQYFKAQIGANVGCVN